MEPKQVVKTIGDHEYTIMLHPAEEGWPLAAEILAMGAEPLARIVETWTKTTDSLDANQDLETVLSQVNWSDVGKDLAAALRLLAQNPTFVAKMLKYTLRDGKGLSIPTVFNEAYQGNYKELGLALKEVVAANGFVPFSF